MLRFFRNFRKNLLAESKFTRYLVYAIGEVMLFVIGILLALQIDNWNDGRKLKVYKMELKVENLQLFRNTYFDF